jgi:hypothetical protein
MSNTSTASAHTAGPDIRLTDAELDIFANLISNISDSSILKGIGARVLRIVAHYRTNADLFAAAPELLEALRNIHAMSNEDHVKEHCLEYIALAEGTL